MKVFKKIIFMVLAVSMILVCVSCKSGKKTGDSEEVDVDTENKQEDENSKDESADIPRVDVDDNGFDSQGRMVAYYASPLIYRDIDEAWDMAVETKPQFSSTELDTSGTFKVLWDDNSLYVLAKVKDSELSVESDTPYMQDSVEIFLDENNDKTVDYGPDDLHFRVNYENVKSIDSGNPDGFFTRAIKEEDGYIILARVSLKDKHENGDVLGLELQINEAKGSNRLGTINIFDSTDSAWSDTSKFGEILLTGKAEGAVSGINPYDLLSLIDDSKNLDKSKYKNLSIIDDAINKIEEVLKDEDISQEQIDEQYEYLMETIDKLVLSDEAANEKHFEVLPGEYRAINDKGGTIERVEYTTKNTSDGKDNKKLNVYLPHGYDPSNSDVKYNVLYLMHGGGENEDLLFGGPGEERELKKIIDNMIDKGDIEPLIVVTPTFYGGKNEATLFYEEWLNDVVPLVETKYNTYVDSGDLDNIKATREHRAFGGFSMGSVATWNVYINCIDYVKYFMPLSGDCWAIGQTAGESKAKETAELLADVAIKGGYSPEEYYLFCATGKLDTAYPNMLPQIEELKKLNDHFIYSSDTSKGNLYFLVSDEGSHAWNWVNQYIYNILPDLFN